VYATSKDFCRIFIEDMGRLYLLARLLTGDHNLAEKCFEGAFHDCLQMDSIFKEFAQPWSRRAIIKQAIRKAKPEISRANESDEAQVNDPFAAIVRLETFERFVFVISILERYSDHECSSLLDSTTADVIRARVSALRHLESIQAGEWMAHPQRESADMRSDGCVSRQNLIHG